MAPRPRKATDAEVIEAALRVMARVGPGDLSLAEIAREVGVTSAALVQRFGSKRDVLLTVMEAWSSGADDMLSGLRSACATPLATIRGYATMLAGMGDTPAELARHLAYLQMDLTDPDFRTHMLRASAATRAHLATWLQEAIDEGELRATADPPRLAALIESLISGSLMSWAVHQDGSAVDWVRRDMETLLAPHLR